MTDRVLMYVVVDGEASEPEDEGVPGVYEVEVDSDLELPQRASAALDAFHNGWGIEVLDDFSFGVLDEQGASVEEDPDHESYSLSDRADFSGKVEGKPPFPAAPAV